MDTSSLRGAKKTNNTFMIKKTTKRRLLLTNNINSALRKKQRSHTSNNSDNQIRGHRTGFRAPVQSLTATSPQRKNRWKTNTV